MAINNNRTSRAKNYIKEFTDFSEGYQELISFIPEVKLYAGTENSYNAVVQRILSTISDNIPSPKNPNFPNTISFSINSREVGLLTDDKIAFGWKIFFNKETATHTYQFRVTFLSVSMTKKKYVDALLNAGWEEFDFAANNVKQSRFWYRLSSNRRNNRQQNFNQENNHNRQQSVQEDNIPATEEQVKNLQEKFNGNTTVSASFEEPVEFNQAPVEESFENTEVPVDNFEDQEVFSIKRGNLDGTYVISCGRDGIYTINFGSDIYPPNSEVDKEKQVIIYNGIVYNCLEGTLYRLEE